MWKILLLTFFNVLLNNERVGCFREMLNLNSKSNKSLHPLPYFRRRVEETLDDPDPERSKIDIRRDRSGNMVSLLVKNVNEVFKDNENEESATQKNLEIEDRIRTRVYDEQGSYPEVSNKHVIEMNLDMPKYSADVPYEEENHVNLPEGLENDKSINIPKNIRNHQGIPILTRNKENIRPNINEQDDLALYMHKMHTKESSSEDISGGQKYIQYVIESRDNNKEYYHGKNNNVQEFSLDYQDTKEQIRPTIAFKHFVMENIPNKAEEIAETEKSPTVMDISLKNLTNIANNIDSFDDASNYNPVGQHKMRAQKNQELQLRSTSTLLFVPFVPTHSGETKSYAEADNLHHTSQPETINDFESINQSTENSEYFAKFIHNNSFKLMLEKETDQEIIQKNIHRKPLPFLINPKNKRLEFETTVHILASDFDMAVTNTLPGRTIMKNSTNESPPTGFELSDSDDFAIDKDQRRSCILCDNVGDTWCSLPKNKLVPSIVCQQENDLCYSMHTPFGIVERGCYNMLYNLSSYVCGCNACNYIAFSDLPMIFSSKQEWIHNVYEISNLRRLRKTKYLQCLRCEVNSTTRGDPEYNRNCMEGQIGLVKTVNCATNEICGIKILKSEGYIWRGCLKKPLYNYYMTLCDTDLCNYDPIASVYDTD